MSNIRGEGFTVTNQILDELDKVDENEEENMIKNKEIKRLLSQVEELEKANKELQEQNGQLKDKNQKMGDQVKRLHELSKKNAGQIMSGEDRIDSLEDQVDSLKDKVTLTEKELEMYKKKLKAEETKPKQESGNEGKLLELQNLLKEKNKKIVDLEIQIKSLQIKNRQSFREISDIPGKKEDIPGIMITSAVSIHSNKKQPDPEIVKPPVNNPGLIDNNSLPLELDFDINMLKKKQDQEKKQNDTLDISPNKQMGYHKRRKSQRDALKDLQGIDFGIKSTPKKPMVNPFEAFGSSHQGKSHYGKRIRKNVNSKIHDKSNLLKKVIEKPENKFGESSKKKKLVYSYDHLNITNNGSLIRIIERTEHVNLQSMSARINFRCLSDNIYRLNKWKNKKAKILIITSRYLYVITPPCEIKRILPLKEIRKITTRGRQDNFVCFFTDTGNDEMFDYFKKNELLLYITGLIKKKNLNIKIKTDAESFQMVTTENKNVTIDPSKLEKFKPIYNNTFNYASERDRLMIISIWKEKFFGLAEKFQKRVGLVTDLGILLFSNVQWDLERFLPFGGRSGGSGIN